MQILKKAKKKLFSIFTQGWSAKKMALSFSIGIFIAFSPFPGVHSVLMFAFKFLFGLNFPILFFATSFNNPWTMVAFYGFDYFWGYWFLHTFLKINPEWTISFARIFGSSEICIWSFIIGGSILGVFFALLSYPFIYILFKKLLLRSNNLNKNCATVSIEEDNNLKDIK